MLTYYDQLSVQVMADEVSRRIMFAAKQIHVEVSLQKSWECKFCEFELQID